MEQGAGQRRPSTKENVRIGAGRRPAAPLHEREHAHWVPDVGPGPENLDAPGGFV
ncbi:MAG: hypothetical protein M3Y81_24450 [Chloroflexota bacterium]|nr:hypothetical protein [Chloroflexota bacterium]